MKTYKKDSLGDRMKRYESVSKTSLVSRMPVILRLDGCHFHSFCRGFAKPFDELLIRTMQDTMLYLCQHIQGCVFGYTQSDEITLVLVDYKKINTSAWFDNEVQKMCSVAASMASFIFNKRFKENFTEWHNFAINSYDVTQYEKAKELEPTYLNAIEYGAYFDCRAFNVPKEDLINCILWRIKDCVRNSIQSLGQHYFSHNQLKNKNCTEIKTMVFKETNLDWENLPEDCKYGFFCFKTDGKWQIITSVDDVSSFNSLESFLQSYCNFF